MSAFTFARSFSTVSCGLLLGSTAWAGAAVMPSLIAADITSSSKLSVFNGLIVRAGLILPPVFLSTISALGFLTYSSVGETRIAYALATGSLVAAMALQSVIVPKNKHMQNLLRQGGADQEHVNGAVANGLIEEILFWNWGRVLLSAIALGAVIYAGGSGYAMDNIRVALDQNVTPVMAARSLEYGLE